MPDIYLDTVTGDMVVTDDIRFTTGIEIVAQSIELRMDATKGEWFADLDNGIDYNGEILGQKFDEANLTRIFRKVLIDTPGVDQVTRLDVTFNGQTRATTITWEARVGDEYLNGSKDL